MIEEYVTVEGSSICVPDALRYDLDDEEGREMAEGFWRSLDQFICTPDSPSAMSKILNVTRRFLRQLEDRDRLYCVGFDNFQRCFVTLEDQIEKSRDRAMIPLVSVQSPLRQPGHRQAP